MWAVEQHFNIFNDGYYLIEVLDNDVAIFTLVTQQQTFVRMNNVPVGTWSSDGFQTIFRKH